MGTTQVLLATTTLHSYTNSHAHTIMFQNSRPPPDAIPQKPTGIQFSW
uniref:Uncharacterized protein n=1 Tax=Rhizophora mucronata TaxID=61149 RepID=A0A2P2QFH9_RHIMU